MVNIDFRGKTYEIKKHISFGDLLEIQEIQEQVKAINEMPAGDAKNVELGKLGGKNLKVIANVLSDCLGLTSKDLKGLELGDAVALFNEVVAGSANISPN